MPTPDEISESLEQLRSSFAALVTRLCSRLEDHIKNKKIKLKDVVRFIEEYLYISAENAESIDDLFNCIRGYYSFLNCPVIECIADEFLFIKEKDNDLQQEMRDYMSELGSFKVSTKLHDLLSAIHTALRTGVKVVLMFNSQWENETMKGFESLLLHYFDRSDLSNYIQMEYQGKYS